MALKGATKSIKYAKAIYLEVNEKELYKNCGLIAEIDAFLAQYKFKRVLTNMTQHGWGGCFIYYRQLKYGLLLNHILHILHLYFFVH